MKNFFFFVLLWLTLCNVHSQTIWHQPIVKENRQIEGYFSSLLNITRVEFDRHETRLYMHVSLRPELRIQFSKDTYLNAEGKSYAVKGCDGLELGKETFLTPNGNVLQVHSFPTYKIVDKQGNILDIKVDARSLDALEKIVKKLSEE